MGRTKVLEEPKQFAKYQLIAQLALGRLGTVYRAKIVGLEGFEKIVTLKAINLAYSSDDAFVDTLVMESQRVVALSHANIAQVFDLGQEPSMGQYYIASEYIAGFDLRRLMDISRVDNRALPIEIVSFIISEVAKGLDYAHRCKDFNFNNLNICHRAISPENLLVSFDGEIKLTDFGISNALQHIRTETGRDKIRRLRYASPEVARGEQGTQSSDIFSLGLVFYELLTGTHPYESDDPDEVLALALNGTVPSLHERDLPRQVVTIIESMLVPNPEGRTASAGTVFEDLISFIYGHSMRADARATSVLMQELRRAERKHAPEDSTQEAGVHEISLTDLSVLEVATREIDNVPEVTDAALPSAKLNLAMGGIKPPSLPGALEGCFESARNGEGKAILVSGVFGAGRTFLADRLVDALSLRGEVHAFAAVVGLDDRLVPFGALGGLMLQALGAPDNPSECLRTLESWGATNPELEVFGSFWGLRENRHMPSTRKLSLLVSACSRVIAKFTQNGVLALIVDKVDEIDDLSRNVLRELTRHVRNSRLMLVMFTEFPEGARERFNVGDPQALEAVNAVGIEPPTSEQIKGLTPESERVLTLVGLVGGVVPQSAIAQMTGMELERLNDVLRELTDRQFLRIPRAGQYTGGIRGLDVWAEGNRDALYAANVAGRYLLHRDRQESTRIWPTLIRLYAVGGERAIAVETARRYASWLQEQGWHETALRFYEWMSDLLASLGVSSIQTRIEFMLSRAELALDLSLIDETRKTLEPIRALTHSHRDARGAIRGLLLQGRLCMQTDDIVDAKKHFERAIAIANTARKPELYAKTALELARWFMRFGDPISAQQMLERAITVFDRVGTTTVDLPTRALLLNRSVRLYAERELITIAEKKLDHLESVLKAHPTPKVRARVAWSRSSILVAQGDYEEAKHILGRAEADAQHFGLQAIQIELMRERAFVSLLSGDFEGVVRTTTTLLQIAARHQDRYSLQRARDLRATALCVLGRETDGAIAHLRASLARAKEREIPRDIYRCHINLSTSLDALGSTDEAGSHARAAVLFASRLRYSAVA